MVKCEVVIIGSSDDPDAGWERAKNLVEELKTAKVPVRLINKLGFVLEDLLLVARYKVVTTPTTLVLKAGKVVYRRIGLESSKTIVEAVKRLQTA